MHFMHDDSEGSINKMWKPALILLSFFLLVACDRGHGQTNWGEKKISHGSVNLPTEIEVKKLVGDAKFDFPGEYEKSIPISDRILDGFEVGPAWLKTEDGASILWGFKFQEGSLESIMVIDADGKLVLAGVVDNIVRLIDGPSSVVSSIAQYQDKLKSVHSEPASVTLFVSEKSELIKYLPLVKRWIQADFLGMNVSCEQDLYKPACALLPDVDVPISAYVRGEEKRGDGVMKELSVPDLLPSEIPFEKFKQ